jgi:hypothetical protein
MTRFKAVVVTGPIAAMVGSGAAFSADAAPPVPLA